MHLTKLFDKVKSLIKGNVCVKFYDETKPLYLETNSSESGLGATPLQTMDGVTCPRDIAPDNAILRPITFAGKGLTSAEQNTVTSKGRHWVYCMVLKDSTFHSFAREVSIITNHKPQEAIFKKDVATLSQRITVHSPQDTTILSLDTIQAWIRSFHCRLAF